MGPAFLNLGYTSKQRAFWAQERLEEAVRLASAVVDLSAGASRDLGSMVWGLEGFGCDAGDLRGFWGIRSKYGPNMNRGPAQRYAETGVLGMTSPGNTPRL